jgi:hypothetical protein
VAFGVPDSFHNFHLFVAKIHVRYQDQRWVTRKFRERMRALWRVHVVAISTEIPSGGGGGCDGGYFRPAGRRRCRWMEGLNGKDEVIAKD